MLNLDNLFSYTMDAQAIRMATLKGYTIEICSKAEEQLFGIFCTVGTGIKATHVLPDNER